MKETNVFNVLFLHVFPAGLEAQLGTKITPRAHHQQFLPPCCRCKQELKGPYMICEFYQTSRNYSSINTLLEQAADFVFS